MTLKQKEIFLRKYIERLMGSNGYKNEHEVRTATFNFLKSWEELGFTKDELNSLFEKVSALIKYPKIEMKIKIK
jgi:hypothetical protein